MEKQQLSNGVKAHQRGKDKEHRAAPYLDWHRQLDRRSYALDIDHVEWRIRNGKMVPVATIELTRVDDKSQVTDKYLMAVVRRFENRDLQGYAAKYIATALGVPCYIVLFSKNCEDFWTYTLTDSSKHKEWSHRSKDEMADFINGL